MVKTILFGKLYETPKIHKNCRGFDYDASHRHNLVINGKVVGGVDLYRMNKYMVLSCLEIYKTYRKKGYGTILLQQIEKYCLKNRIYKIYLSVSHDNKKAYYLYEKFGFKISDKDNEYARFSIPWAIDMVKTYEVKLLALEKSPKIDGRLSTYFGEEHRLDTQHNLVINGKVVGAVDIYDYGEGSAYLYCLEIFRKYRGKGYSHVLLKQIEKICLLKGITVLSLNVDKDNTIAEKLYEKNGYVWKLDMGDHYQLTKGI